MPLTCLPSYFAPKIIRFEDTDFSPSTPLIASTALSGIWPDAADDMEKSAFNPVSTMSFTEALAEVATTLRQETIATPTNRAAAVFEVRRFCRERLRVASRPVTWNTCAGIQPKTAPAGETQAGPATITPMTISAAPTPSGQPVPVQEAKSLSQPISVGSPSASAMRQVQAQVSAPTTIIVVPMMPRVNTGFSGFTVSFIA